MSESPVQFEGTAERKKWNMDYLGIAYAVIVVSGGAFGYAKSKSVPSLAAGLLFGTAIAYGAYQVSRNHYHTPSLIASSSLGALMGYKFASSGKIMPAGLLTGISVAMTVRYGIMAMMNKPMKN
ncbi:transmembrane protein 14C [Cimex lectularius]|uniref:Transmembrane protein 14C n=1 Tax=Cimex lectularius TaxID=79782 RepID=A0A8I6TF63_CIMLE|nr:transmembrane protein 14C [Cimex lectularius]XP_014245685.1 transmembrane protein 14C [Cimex lectularius]XP_014245686.1 transmembrane protein 14C [Cimex lectularius]